MKKRPRLESFISNLFSKTLMLGSFSLAALGIGLNINKANAQIPPENRPFSSLEDSLERILKPKQEETSMFNPYDTSWDAYEDRVIKNYMNIPLQGSYEESIPLTYRNDTVAYFRIYAGFRDTSQQNIDFFWGIEGTGESSNGCLIRAFIGQSRIITIYNEGVYPEQEEEWSKEQSCYGQDLSNDSLYKFNLLGSYQKRLVKFGMNIEKKLFTSSTGLLHVAKSLIDLPIEGINFITMEDLVGQLELKYAGDYREPIVGEDIILFPPLGLFNSYGIKARNERIAWRSTKHRRPLKVYLEVELVRSVLYEGLWKFVNFGMGKHIVRTFDIPQRTETK
jgi:hypothetical protein